MFEAYKVGVTLALNNQVSGALGMIARHFATTNAQAKALQGTLKQIKLLAIGGALIGGAGFLGLGMIKSTLGAAEKYTQALNQFKAINLGDSVNKDADNFARGTAVFGASATDLIETVRDLHMAFNDYGMAKALAPQIAQMKFANQAVFGEHGGMSMDRAQLQAMEKIIEMKGGFKSPDAFMAQANMMQKVISGTGGMVKPSDFLQFIKTSGVSGRLLSNETFYYTMEPLIQEMSGGRVGTGTMSAYNNLAQGRSTVRAAREMMKLGILNPNMVEYDKIGQVKRILPGALAGMDEFTSNPYQWMKDVLVPHMAARGITSENGVLNEMGAIFGNRTGSNLFSLMYLQQDKIAKNMAISKNAMDVNQLLKLAKSSPQGADMALGTAWDSLKTAIGVTVIPIIIPAIVGLANAFSKLGAFLSQHGTLTAALTYTFGGLSSLAAIGGTLMVAGAGIKLIGVGLAPMTTALSAMSGISLTGIGAGLASVAAGFVAIAAPLATLYGILHHKEIADWVDSHAPAIGDKLLAAKNFSYKDWILGAISGPQYSFAPPSSGKPIQVQTQVNIDGRQVAKVVTQHQTSAMNGPATSGSGFDGRQSYVPAGYTGSW